eukprot:16199-Heterococcus_DN1.PRE.1
MKVPEFGLFVREDGTVDWDGAIQSGREVAKFGKELWERINGQDPHAEDANNKQQLFGGGKERREKVDPPSVQVCASLCSSGAGAIALLRAQCGSCAIARLLMLSDTSCVSR